MSNWLEKYLTRPRLVCCVTCVQLIMCLIRHIINWTCDQLDSDHTIHVTCVVLTCCVGHIDVTYYCGTLLDNCHSTECMIAMT